MSRTDPVRMKVAFDQTSALLNNAGTGTYARNLYSSLSVIAAESDLDLVPVSMANRVARLTKGSVLRRIGVAYRSMIGRHIELPVRVARQAPELFHSPDNLLPLYSPVPTVVTMHDTAVFDYPEGFNLWQRLEWRLLSRLSLRQARRVLVVSASSKHDIMRHFGLAEEKIKVTPNAAASHFRPMEDDYIDQVRRKYGLEKYILTVGTLEPRKNHAGLFDAYHEARRRGMLKNVSLVHIGPVGWKRLPNVASSVHSDPDIHFLGFLPESELVALMCGALAMAYLSFFEGFGLPLLESMQCGTPVVCSDIPVFHEVVGDAGLFVDPYSPSEIADALIKLSDHKNGVLRTELRAKGLDRSQLFSWQKCAVETIAVYRAALKDRHVAAINAK